MRTQHHVIVIGVLLASGCLASCQTPVVAADPAPAKPQKPVAAPVLQSVSMRYDVPTGNGAVISVVPDFHFIAPNGNAVLIHRELVATSGAPSHLVVPATTAIDTPAEVQKKGAVVSGSWRCGTAQYFATLSAYIMDADGNKSNSLQYTIHCNGG